MIIARMERGDILKTIAYNKLYSALFSVLCNDLPQIYLLKIIYIYYFRVSMGQE